MVLVLVMFMVVVKVLVVLVMFVVVLKMLVVLVQHMSAPPVC